MMSASANATRWAILALAAVLIAWHGFIDPAAGDARWWVLGLFLAPLAPSLFGLVARKRSAIFWGGVAALFYFCHAVAEAWSTPSARAFAVIELALSLLIIVAGSWDGMRARSRKSKGSPPPV